MKKEYEELMDQITEQEAEQMLSNMPINNARLLSAVLGILEEKGVITREEVDKRFDEIIEEEKKIIEEYTKKHNGGVEIEE